MSVPAPAAVSHAQLLATARKTTEPLSINGTPPLEMCRQHSRQGMQLWSVSMLLCVPCTAHDVSL